MFEFAKHLARVPEHATTAVLCQLHDNLRVVEHT